MKAKTGIRAGFSMFGSLGNAVDSGVSAVTDAVKGLF